MYIKALLHLKLYLKRNYNPVVLKKFVSVPDKSLLQTLLVSSGWMNQKIPKYTTHACPRNQGTEKVI